MPPDVFILLLYFLTGPNQGHTLEYETKYKSKIECLEARIVVRDKILKDNPTVTPKEFDKNFILVCSKDKDTKA
jgi:hypothetical protein